MSTNSSVTVKHSDGKYWSIYGHWDGYFDSVGQTLHDHYNSQELAEALVSLGDFSTLHKFMDNPSGHSYDTPATDRSVFYHRDRGEDWEDTQPNIGDTHIEAATIQGYDYLWDGERWLVISDHNEELLTIAEALALSCE